MVVEAQHRATNESTLSCQWIIPRHRRCPLCASLPLVSLTLGIILVLSVWLTVDKIVDLGRAPVTAQISP